MIRFQGNCCLDCQDRKVGCHGACARCIAAKKAHEEKIATVWKMAHADNDANDYKQKSIVALRKRKVKG